MLPIKSLACQLVLRKKGPAIIVNTRNRISTERQIFSAAHELGHLLMHVSEDKEKEQEADLFAGHFLMPKDGFDKEWADTFGMSFLDRVMKVKRIFRVSYKTVLYRLVQEGEISDSIWRQFPSAFERYYGKKLSQKEEPSFEGAEPYATKLTSPTMVGEPKQLDFVCNMQ